MGCVERKQREKEQVRQSILDAALKIAVEEGWHALTIRKIADAIEYTPPIVYEHFENKEELIQELFLSGFRELQKGYDLKNQPESDPKKIIMSLSLNHWDFAFKHKDLYQLMFSLERPIPNEEMKTGILLIKNVFMQLANKDEQLSQELMFNWMCLQSGVISTIIKKALPPGLSKTQPRDLFKSVIERFLNSI